MKYSSPNDESVQSYIFRLIKQKGFHDYRCVLVPKHGWGESPSLPFELSTGMYNFNKSKLTNLLEKCTLVPDDESMFSHHFDYISRVQNTFYPKKVKKSAGRGFEVKFCKSCMKEQVVEFGFAYFKFEWRYRVTCLKHGGKLFVLRPLPLGRLVAAIDNILSCNFDVIYNISDQVLERPTSTPTNIYDRGVKFAPCARGAFIEWMLNQVTYYPEGYYEISDYGYLCMNLKRVLSLWLYRKDLEKNTDRHYALAINDNYDRVIAFLHDDIVLHSVMYNNEGFKSSVKKIFKDHKISCDDCMMNNPQYYRDCPNNKLLFLSDESRHLIEYKYYNYCENRFNRLLEEVHQHQRSVGVTEGYSRLRRDINMSLAYKTFGGEEAFIKAITKPFDHIG